MHIENTTGFMQVWLTTLFCFPMMIQYSSKSDPILSGMCWVAANTLPTNRAISLGSLPLEPSRLCQVICLVFALWLSMSMSKQPQEKGGHELNFCIPSPWRAAVPPCTLNKTSRTLNILRLLQRVWGGGLRGDSSIKTKQMFWPGFKAVPLNPYIQYRKGIEAPCVSRKQKGCLCLQKWMALPRNHAIDFRRANLSRNGLQECIMGPHSHQAAADSGG